MDPRIYLTKIYPTLGEIFSQNLVQLLKISDTMQYCLDDFRQMIKEPEYLLQSLLFSILFTSTSGLYLHKLYLERHISEIYSD